jgi:uncharacterized OB-fold protein
MAETNGKNLPRPTPETKPYWDACQQHQFLIQRCNQCSHYQFYPRILCTACMSRDVTWVAAKGLGQVLSYTIIHRAISKAYAAEVPYIVALIQLQEGPTMMSNVVGCDPAKITIGMPVRVAFEDRTEEITVPVFRPVDASEDA